MDYLLVLTVLAFLFTAHAITYDGSPNSWTAYEKLNLCPNSDASIFLDLRAEEDDGLLLYMDDGGTSDYLLVQLINGNIRLEYRFGPGTTQNPEPAQFTSEKQIPVDSVRSIMLTRDRMRIMLKIDANKESATQKPDYGTDLCFGECQSDYQIPGTNSPLYVGGVPDHVRARSLTSLPSGFKGDIFHVEYKNCECKFTNPHVLEVGDSLREKVDDDRCFNLTDSQCLCRLNTQTGLCSCGTCIEEECSGM